MKLTFLGLLVTSLSLLLHAKEIDYSTKTVAEKYCKPLSNERRFCMEYKVTYPQVVSEDHMLQDHLNHAI